MTSRTYAVTTLDRDYSSADASKAADVACAWKRRGLEPSATVIIVHDGAPLEFRNDVPITTVRKTANALANA